MSPPESERAPRPGRPVSQTPRKQKREYSIPVGVQVPIAVLLPFGFPLVYALASWGWAQ
jgi:hypothetical protein